MGLKGDLYVDFAVGIALFMFAFIAVFSYISGECSYRMDYENTEAQKMNIDQIFESFPKAEVEKRLVLVRGFSENEFVNLSGFDTDLILDEENEPVCFDRRLGGFLANVSGERIFSVFSTKEMLTGSANICNLSFPTDRLEESISSPIYLKILLEKPANLSGSYCGVKQVSYLTDNGFEKAYVKICI